MSNLPKIYNSRILKLYTLCIREHYPDVDVDAVLSSAGISRHELDDQGHWFDQDEIDAFFNKVVKETGNTGIAREAGRFVVANETSGPVKQMALGLLQIASIYMLLPKLYPNFSRGAEVQTRKLASNRVEISVKTKPGVTESPHQCDNRIGIFESFCMPFTGRYATIEHTECMHHQGDCCRYQASWEESRHVAWKRRAAIAMIAAASVSIAAIILWPVAIWLPLVLVCLLVVLAFQLKTGQVHNEELASLIQNQGNVAEAHIQEIEYRYQGALLVQKIGRASATLLSKRELARTVIHNIEHYLDFDRGLMMLANENRSRLVYAAGYGFDDNVSAILERMSFRLDNPDSKGVFVRVFHKQKPVLVEDIDALSKMFSAKSQRLIRQIGTKSMICLPIVYERQSMGILAVDNIITKRPLTKSDMNLLMAVAYQTAVSLFSADAFRNLRRSEARYRSLYENAPTAFISISIQTASIVNCNAAAERLLAHPRSRLVGSSLLDYVAGDDASQQRAKHIMGTLARGAAVHNEALEFKHPDGSSIWALVSVEPHTDARGKLLEGRCILVDTTAQRQLQEQLRKAQQMETIGTLAGGVAHDLSNIMAAIVGYPDLLLMDVAPDHPMYDPLVKLRSAGSRAAAIVQDLLTLSRRGVPITDVVELNALFNEYLESPEYENLREHYPQIKMDVDLAPDLHPIKGSPVHLIKSFMNVISNAAEALGHGGSIRVQTRNQFVPAGQFPEKHVPGHFVVFSVNDNGYGIAAEDLKRIFEPFFTKKAMGRSGTGLGMAIVWGAVEDHGGFIDIHSEMGSGTTVELYFPATEEKPATKPTAPDLSSILGSGERIWIVDASPDHLEIAQRMLSRLGYQIDIAESDAALLAQHAVNTAPDAILVDATVVNNTGEPLYQTLDALIPGDPAIIASGGPPDGRPPSNTSLPSCTWVKKPYKLKDLGAGVRHALDARGCTSASTQRAVS